MSKIYKIVHAETGRSQGLFFGKLEGKFEQGSSVKITELNGVGSYTAFEHEILSTKNAVTTAYSSVSIGTFINGELEGEGERTIFHKDGNTDYKGVFKNNKIVLGKVYHHSKGIIREGIYDCQKLTEGKYTDKNGDIYEGKFDENGRLYGRGKLTTAIYTFEGDFSQDKPHGLCTKTFNGDIITGLYINAVPSGLFKGQCIGGEKFYQIYDNAGNLTHDSRTNMHQASAPAIAPALEAKQGEIP